MRKLLVLLCCWPALALSANVYNYFAPALAGAGATCAANQVWYLNAAGTLVNCSAQMTFNPTGADLQLGAAGGTTAALDLYAASAATDAHKTRILADATGRFLVEPVNDAGTVTTNNFLRLRRTGTQFQSLDYSDTSAGGTVTSFTVNPGQFAYVSGSGTGGQNLSFSIDGEDMKFTSAANNQPVFQFKDPGSGDALAGGLYFTGTGVSGNELATYCVSPAFSLGAPLTNGPANNLCVVSLGDQLFGQAPSTGVLAFGANGGTFAGMIDNGLNWVLDRATSHATNQTNGFVYLPKTAGVPSGTPANLTGLYATSAPFVYDSTDNRLYGYNGSWQNLTPANLLPLNNTWAGNNVFSPASGAGVRAISPANNVAPIEADCISGTYSANGNTCLSLVNSSAAGQTPIDFYGNAGVFSGRIRNDFAGNMAYVATASGAHSFFTGGDSGVGTMRMSVGPGTTLAMPTLPQSSSATTGTVCWTTGTGALTVDTTTTCLLSNARYKESVAPLHGALAEVMQLRPVSYRLKPQYDPSGQGVQIGLISEQAQAVDARLVGRAPDGTAQGVRYAQLTALLIKAIQEQQREIAQLKQSGREAVP